MDAQVVYNLLVLGVLLVAVWLCALNGLAAAS